MNEIQFTCIIHQVHFTWIMLIITVSLLPVTFGLRISDAWVEDIETLEPARSNRIETYVFPSKHEDLTKDKYRIKDVTRDIAVGGLSFEPMYFKLKSKLEDELKLSTIDKSFAIPENKYTIQGTKIQI